MALESHPTPARTRRGADRRREILDAAREVFSAKGYERGSMAEIASKVGIVEGTIYKHFAGKRELLFEATRAFYAPIISSARQHLTGIRGTRNRLRYVIWRQLQGFVDEPGICRLIIQEIRPYDDYYESVVRELNREATSLVLDIVEQAMERGELRRGVQPALVRDVIYGGMEHLAWKALSGRGSIDVEQLADDLTELILCGVGLPATTEEDACGGELSRLRAQVDRLETLIDGLRAGAQEETRQ